MIKPLLRGLILISLLSGCQTPPQIEATSTPPVEPPITATVPSLPTATAPVVAYVGGSLPCFAGPQVDENIVDTIEITNAPEIRGIDDSGQFWAIQFEGGGFCWIEAAFVTTSDDSGRMRTIMPTRTPLPPKPSAPTNAAAEYKCHKRDLGRMYVDVTLSWDNTEWAEGYRIYREGRILAELDASEIIFIETLACRFFGLNGLAIYTIEAYNARGWFTVDVPIKWNCNQ